MDVCLQIKNYVQDLQKAQMNETLYKLEKYILNNELKKTGLLLTFKELSDRVQSAFWLLKDEGAINRYNWLMVPITRLKEFNI